MTNDDTPLDLFSSDALLDGSASVSGDPLSDMFVTLSGGGLPAELEGESAAIQSMAAAITTSAAAKAPRSRRRLTTRASALAAAGSLVFSGVAAAAAGVPVPVVSEVVDELFRPDATPTLVDTDEIDGTDQQPLDVGDSDAPVSDDEGSSLDPDGDAGKAAPQRDSDDQTPSGEGPADGTKGDDSPVGEPGNSGRAHSECGKPFAEPNGDPECLDADNHGGHVSEGNGNGNGENGNANGNGNGNSNGENGNANSNAGNNGNGNKNND